MQPTPATLPARIPSLDGFRGFFFMVVFVAHSGLIPPDATPLLRFAANAGDLSLSIFFFLSGYVITTLMRLEYESTGRLDMGRFFLRRFYRLVPSFLIVLVAGYLIAFALGMSPGRLVEPFLAQLLQFTNYYAVLVPQNILVGIGTGPIWSLAVENHFYLMFPFLFVALMRLSSTRKIIAVLVAICVVIAIGRWYAFVELELPRAWVKYLTHARLDSILGGCILALWRNPILDNPPKTGAMQAGFSSLIALIVALGVVFLPLGGWERVILYSVQGFCFIVLFTAAIQHADTLAFRWLNSRLMIYLGTLSYTLYLSHLVILRLVNRVTDWEPLVVATVGLALTIAYSDLSFRFIEEPMAKLRRRLH